MRQRLDRLLKAIPLSCWAGGSIPASLQFLGSLSQKLPAASKHSLQNFFLPPFLFPCLFSLHIHTNTHTHTPDDSFMCLSILTILLVKEFLKTKWIVEFTLLVKRCLSHLILIVFLLSSSETKPPSPHLGLESCLCSQPCDFLHKCYRQRLPCPDPQAS